MPTLRDLAVKSSWPLILACSALAIATLALAIGAYISYGTWASETERFRRFSANSGPERCERIAEQCRAQVAPTLPRINTTFPSSRYGVFLACEELDGAKGSSTACVQAYEAILACGERLSRQQGIDCYVTQPEPFAPYYFNSLSSAHLPELALVAWLCVILSLYVLRTFLAESSTGWRRIAVVASPITAGSLALIGWLARWEQDALLAVAVTGLVLGFVGVLLARRMHRWICDGFAAEQSTSSTISPLSSSTSPSEAASPLSPRRHGWRNFGIAVGIVGLFLFSFLANPERSLMTLIASTVQVVVVVTVIYIGRWIISWLRSWRK